MKPISLRRRPKPPAKVAEEGWKQREEKPKPKLKQRYREREKASVNYLYKYVPIEKNTKTKPTYDNREILRDETKKLANWKCQAKAQNKNQNVSPAQI